MSVLLQEQRVMIIIIFIIIFIFNTREEPAGSPLLPPSGQSGDGGLSCEGRQKNGSITQKLQSDTSEVYLCCKEKSFRIVTTVT